MIFNSLEECMSKFYIYYEYKNDACISANNIGCAELIQDGLEIKNDPKYISSKERKKRENTQYQYCKQTVSANMPRVYDLVNMCIDIERVLNKRTDFEQHVIYLYVVDGRVEALDYMIQVYGFPNNCKSMNDLDKRLDEILYSLECDLIEIDCVKKRRDIYVEG